MNFLVSYFFLTLVDAIGKAGTFWLYGALGIVVFTYFMLRVPETRNRSLEEIEADIGVEAEPAVTRRDRWRVVATTRRLRFGVAGRGHEDDVAREADTADDRVGYSPHEARPLGGYAHAAGDLRDRHRCVGARDPPPGCRTAARRRGRSRPARRDDPQAEPVGDACDAASSPFRAPFTRYLGPAGDGELREEPRAWRSVTRSVSW